MSTVFPMVAKTFAGLEGVLAEELRTLGAENVEPGNRMVAFEGDLAMMYKANLCCRTALRILKPFLKFTARDADELYDRAKEFDWGKFLRVDQTFSIDTVAFSDEFRHSQFATYRVKDAIMDWFKDHTDGVKRPRVCLEGADICINVHIAGREVIFSLDSSGESLHRRGYRRAQTDAPINEVLAAGIILLSGWKGDTPFVDPMCGSGTFVIEAALIAANIIPGVFRQHFAFENWPDFDRELFETIYNDDSAEREITVPIIGSDISRKAIEIATENAKGAGVASKIQLEVKRLESWTEAPAPAGVMVTNPPYGKRIVADDMNALYHSIGTVLKHVFTGYHAWIIGYEDEYFHEIGLAPSQKIAINNGGLDCELREYVIFEGKKSDFRAGGGSIKNERPAPARKPRPAADRKGDRRNPLADRIKERFDRKGADRKPYDRDRKNFDRRDDRRDDRRRDDNAPERERRPIDLKRLGRRPSIPADKAIDMRPTWKARNLPPLKEDSED